MTCEVWILALNLIVVNLNYDIILLLKSGEYSK